MRKVKVLISMAMVAALAFMMTACGGTKAEDKPAETPAATETPAEAESDEPEGDVDYAHPDIVIEFGDHAAIEKLAKDNQNFETAEGTIVKITGILNTDLSTPTINEEVDESNKVGVSFYVDGDWEAPANGSKIELTGVIVQGNMFMKLQVPSGNISVVE
ncbi:MAG: hypothetical protein Q4B73_01550 [Lachnospiraceae bacterium]|nr:hypothetical protein [Lachnospiraceae bacterium]